MSKETIRIEISLPPWSEALKSWYFLTENNGAGVWSGGSWFPKKVCHLDEPNSQLVIPSWLYEKKIKEGVVLKKV